MRRWILALGTGLAAGLGVFLAYHRPLTVLGTYLGVWPLTRQVLSILVAGAVVGLVLLLTRRSSGDAHGER